MFYYVIKTNDGKAFCGEYYSVAQCALRAKSEAVGTGATLWLSDEPFECDDDGIILPDTSFGYDDNGNLIR